MGRQTIARDQICIIPSLRHSGFVVGSMIRIAGASAASEGGG